jgi:hypothetical protein
LGYLFKFADGTICHCSSKQKLITTSTTEAKYVGLTHAAKEAAWLACLLQQIGYLSKDGCPIKLYSDNKSSIYLVHAKGHHKRTKYINISYYYIKNQVRNGHIQLKYISTKDMATDSFTNCSQPIFFRLDCVSRYSCQDLESLQLKAIEQAKIKTSSKAY